MRIALAPDLHCYYSTYSKTNADGKSTREQEWDTCAKSMFDDCIKAKVDVLVAPGDFFTNPRPTAAQVLRVASLFRKFEDSGIKVVGICGNHDISGVNAKTMNDVVDAIGEKERWCFSTFGTTVIGDVGFALLPYVKNAQIAAYNPDFQYEEMADNLIQVAYNLKEELKRKGAKKHILVGHWSIDGAKFSNNMSVKNTQETVLSHAALFQQGWDACLFGHIHKPQILDEKPFIAYSGCMQRIAINEADDERLFYVYDTESGEHESYPLPALEMLKVKETVESEEDAARLMERIQSLEVENKIVQVRYDIDKNVAGLVDKRKVYAALAARNPLYIVNVVPNVVDRTRAERMDFSEGIDAVTALKKWADIKKYDAATQKKMIELMAKYDQETII